MRFSVRHLILGLLVFMCSAGSASAQYMKITTDNPTDNTKMRATGTTLLTITLDTNHDRNGATQTCNSHSEANCGAAGTPQTLDMFSYTLALHAIGGTVTWGTYTPADAAYTESSPLISSDTEIEINRARPTGTVTPAGLATLGSIPVTVLTGEPGIFPQIGASVLNPFGFGTGFGTPCDGFFFPNTYVLGDPADPCGDVTGVAGDWFDADGALSPSGNTPPGISAPLNATATENVPMTTITATATDADAANTLTVTQTGMPADLTFSSTPGTSPVSATVSGTPGFADAGTFSVNWLVNDGAGGTANTSTVLEIANTNRGPTLVQPANMTVNENSTAEQVITGTDPDSEPLTFSKISGPAFMTVIPIGGTSATVRLVTGFSDAGTSSATVRATDGDLSNDKSFTITVNAANRPPFLNQPSNMTVNENATADQVVSGTDPDADALTFTKTTGPAFMTVTTTNATTGNVHLAPGAGTAGTYSASVTASDGSLTDVKNLNITVNGAANGAPTLDQPANMTVSEGATANQVITGTDPDGNALTFSKVSGPTYLTVTTTDPTTGSIHLAPGFTDSGTASATVRATDTGALFNEKSLTVTVTNVDRAPTLAPVADMTVGAGSTADQGISATDLDGDAITFTSSGPAFLTRTDNVQVGNTRTGSIHLAPPGGTSGTFSASVTATANGQSASDAFVIDVTGAANQAPTLTQPANMTVAEGATANQVITGTDPDADALTFSLVSGPTYATVTTTNATTGNIALAPGFADAGTAAAVVRATDTGALTNDKTLTITVTNTNRAPTLSQPADMTVDENATADQAINGFDTDDEPLTFTKVTGPTFMTVTTVDPGTGTASGNIHLAPGFADAGSYAATVRASDGTASFDRSLTITVDNLNRAPTLNQPANMTVDEGATANQAITGIDPDSDALTFSKVSGPTYATVTTTNATTGNIALAPGFSDAGTASLVVRAADTGALTDDKTLTVTVNNVDRPVSLDAVADMVVAAGSTADQTANATDPDGDAIGLTAAGPAFMTFTPNAQFLNSRTGSIHLAPPLGTTGTFSASVTATANGTETTRGFTITVNATNQAPIMDQPSDMTVNEGDTADQSLLAQDPDANPLTFSKTAGPAFMTVATLSPTLGNIHLAPGFEDAGTHAATVRATDGGLNSDRSLSITVNDVNRPPVLTAIPDVTVTEGATVDQPLTASDPDGDALTFTKATGPAFATVTTLTPSTGNLHFAPVAGDTLGSPYSASVTASDGSLADTKSLSITVNPPTPENNAPALAQPSDMTVDENTTADQTLDATDSDGDAITFTRVSGPTFATVSTTSPGTGTATGNIHVAPGSSDAGTHAATVRASDGTLTDDKSLTITVNDVNRAPTLQAVSDMTVAENATADQVITGADPDGDALTFSKASGPTFLTITTTNATEGNVHLAPTTGDAADSPYAASAQVSDGTLTDSKPFSITVEAAGEDEAPVLAQPSDMTVDENATADQTLNATDSDGDPITFTKAAGPAFVTVSTTDPGTGTATGNIHLAPGSSDAGTHAATVRASDGTLNDEKTFSITVNDVDRAPEVAAPSSINGEEGGVIAFNVSSSDPDGDAIDSFTADFPSLPGGNDASFTTDVSKTTGSFQWHPQPGDAGGTYSVVFTASNGLSGSATTALGVDPANTGANGLLTWTPQAGDQGVYDVVFTATDAGGTSTFTSTITVGGGSAPTPPSARLAPQATQTGPIISGTSTVSVQPGSEVTVSVYATSDPTTTTTVSSPIRLRLVSAVARAVQAITLTADLSHLPSGNNAQFSIVSGPANGAPTLTQPLDMTVNEGATADQTLNATDPDLNPLTFSLVSGPAYASVTTTSPGTGTATGNLHLAPGFSDAGTASATVRASDGSLNDERSFTITVTQTNQANQPPVADAGGPYTGTAGSPVAFNGTGSSDPDGNALSYSWDFDASDGITAEATGATPSHTYAAAGAFTATLTVTDDGTPALSDTDTATATISGGGEVFEAKATLRGGDRVIRLGSQHVRWCVLLEPKTSDWQVSDIVRSSILATFNGVSIHPVSIRRLTGRDCGDHGRARLEICFKKSHLQRLFASLPKGHRWVEVDITGDLEDGGSIHADVKVFVVKGFGGFVSHDEYDDDADAQYADGRSSYASPNPLNPSTTIHFELSAPGSVRLHIYDVAGRLVKTLADEFMGSGAHHVAWDGTSRSGSRVASGVYFYVLETPGRTVKSQLVVAK